jgi:AcrR family transcriptional regulator
VRRPRDRRQQIIAAAAEQFRASGFHNVGITELADAVGITSAALYRHFRGKQDLLLATVQDAVDQLAAVWSQDYSGLEDLFRATCAIALERPDGGVLWSREVAHLAPEEQQALRAQLLMAVEPVRAAIAESRPGLQTDEVDLLLWASLGVSVSLGYHSVRVEERRLIALLAGASVAVCRVTPHGAAAGASPRVIDATSGTLLPASRQEAILLAAVRLFSSRGYQDVGVDDIGAAAGITGATVYHHFANKSAILVAALERCLQALYFDLSSALDAATPEDALEALLRYFMRASVEHGQALGALRNEMISVPTGDGHSLRRAYAEYVAEWGALLAAHRPDLSDVEARILVQAMISSIGSVLAVPHLRVRPSLEDDLVAIGRAILSLDGTPKRLS